MSKIEKLRAYYNKEYDDSLKLLRTERVAQALISCNLDKSSLILDIGCYGCRFLHTLHLQGYTNLHGIDVIEVNNPYDFKFEFTQCDIENGLPFKDGSVDVIVTSHVLEHLFDVDGAVREIKRVLRKDGIYVLALPLDTNLFARGLLFLGKPVHDPFQTGTHIKFFKYREVLTYFSNHGLSVMSVDHHSLMYGKYDHRIPLLKTLARMLPSYFSSEMTIVFKNS